jgi:uncharacterized cupin superfamily protein
MTPLLVASAPIVTRAVAGSGAVVTGAISGLATGGALAGIFASLATVALLFLAIAGSNRKNRQDYAAEIAAAKADGVADQKQWTEQERERADRAERDAEYWRGIAMTRDRQPEPREGRD